MNRLTKEVKRLLSKRHIYVKITIEKKRCTQNLNFLSLKKVPHQVSFWGAPAHVDIVEFSNFLFQLKN